MKYRIIRYTLDGCADVNMSDKDSYEQALTEVNNYHDNAHMYKIWVINTNGDMKLMPEMV